MLDRTKIISREALGRFSRVLQNEPKWTHPVWLWRHGKNVRACFDEHSDGGVIGLNTEKMQPGEAILVFLIYEGFDALGG